MRFGTWNVRSLKKSRSITTVHRELTVYKLDLVGVQEVRWDTAGTWVIIVSKEKEKKLINSEQVFCTTQYSINS